MWYFITLLLLIQFFNDFFNEPAICEHIHYSTSDSISRKFISSQFQVTREILLGFSGVRSVRLISAISNLPVAIQHFVRYNVRKHWVPLYDPGELAVCSGQITEIGGTISPNWPPASPWIKNPVRETLFSLIGPRLPRGTDLLENRD